MDAVILAAGFGSRIRDMHDLPKGFIKINDEPIIQRSIRQLKSHGINNILIVTGYCAEYYETLSKTESGITTVFNPNYASSGSLYSLYCAKQWISNNFLILESDILYETRAIDLILNNPHQSAILLSGETQSGDEVYVEAVNQKLINMSKQKNALNEKAIYGEFVGINKLSYDDYQFLISHLNENPKLAESGHYEEHGLVAVTKQNPIFCLKENDLLWCEIDNRNQFERAQRLFTP